MCEQRDKREIERGGEKETDEGETCEGERRETLRVGEGLRKIREGEMEVGIRERDTERL